MACSQCEPIVPAPPSSSSPTPLRVEQLKCCRPLCSTFGLVIFQAVVPRSWKEDTVLFEGLRTVNPPMLR